MGHQIPGGRTVSRRGGLPARGQKPWHGKPASDAPRWLLGRIGFWIALPGLDAEYQRQRLTLARVRRAAATVATWRKRLELQVGAAGTASRRAGRPEPRGDGGRPGRPRR